jgi:hypothetical protein
MMIREYEAGDELRFKPNRYSGFADISDVFGDNNYQKYTLEDNGEVKCILCWYQYEPEKYAIFFLMPDGAGLKHARALKKFLDNVKLRLQPKTCITYSLDCGTLNRWHEFFGFSKKDNEGAFIGGKKFNKWEIQWA